MKKKLLIFHSALAPYRINFFNKLSEEFSATIVFLSDNLRNQNFNRANLLAQITFTPHYLKHKIVINDRDINFGYSSYIFKVQPDIIIGGEYGLPTVIPFLIKKIFRKKYKIYTICDDSVQMSVNCGKIRSIFRHFLAPRLDGIIVVSPNTADWYRSHFTLKSNPIIFPILQEEITFRKKLHLALPLSKQFIKKWQLNNKKAWLFVGRLVEIKGLDRVLKAFASAKIDTDTVLILVGEGELLETLKSQAKNLKISDRVLFVGRYEDTELLAWYNIGSNLILASHQEAFGAVVNEALISGCQVLCSSRAGACCLIQDDVNGYIFDTYNHDDFSEKISIMSRKMPPINESNTEIKPSLMIEDFNMNIENLIHQLY